MGDSTLPPPAEASANPAGWHPDPTGETAWRWWNGHAWTAFTSGAPAATGRRPRLPRWLSAPVVACAPLVLIGIALVVVYEPLAFVAGLVPMLIVLPVLSWLDRVEPEPRASRAHAVMWGASVAVVVALISNTVTAAVAGEVAAMVISAPLVEEAMKGLGVYWAVRRREVDGVTDGVVYAGWVALGFAVVEDMSYFAIASVEGAFVPVFVIRAILTPFAHPLFTIWTGIAIGRAVRDRRPVFPAALWGYALAVAAHTAWNGSLAFGDIREDVDEDVAVGVVLIAIGLFIVLFVAVAVALFLMRRREQRRFERMLPFLTQRYRLHPDEAVMFLSWSQLLRERRRLPRKQRRLFDRVHAALARLSVLHEGMNEIDPAVERVLAAQLHSARVALNEARVS
jgi:RsiW-degrading membrane proteinase PrsW (M82 family)